MITIVIAPSLTVVVRINWTNKLICFEQHDHDRQGKSQKHKIECKFYIYFFVSWTPISFFAILFTFSSYFILLDLSQMPLNYFPKLEIFPLIWIFCSIQISSSSPSFSSVSRLLFNTFFEVLNLVMVLVIFMLFPHFRFSLSVSACSYLKE